MTMQPFWKMVGLSTPVRHRQTGDMINVRQIEAVTDFTIHGHKVKAGTRGGRISAASNLCTQSWISAGVVVQGRSPVVTRSLVESVGIHPLVICGSSEITDCCLRVGEKDFPNPYSMNWMGADAYNSTIEAKQLFASEGVIQSSHLEASILRIESGTVVGTTMKVFGADLHRTELEHADIQIDGYDRLNLIDARVRGKVRRSSGDSDLVTVTEAGHSNAPMNVWFNGKTVILRRGCFMGTLPEFLDSLDESESHNSVSRKAYRALVKALVLRVQPRNRAALAL